MSNQIQETMISINSYKQVRCLEKVHQNLGFLKGHSEDSKGKLLFCAVTNLDLPGA